MKKTALVLGVIATLAVIAYSQRASIAGRIMDVGLERMMGANLIADLDDGLHLTLCGAGGPMPAPKASGPCVAVVAGEQFFVVDTGTDGPRNLGRMNYPIGDLDGVFITHFHSDHIDGLGELSTLRWAAGDNTSPLPVYGPTGVEKVVEAFNAAYSQDFVYRHEHHGDTVAPMSGAGMTAIAFDVPAKDELTVVYEKDGLKVEMLVVDHFPIDPAVGYRFSYKGRTLLISGDTTKQANLQAFSEGIDLLVHEALAPNLLLRMNAAAKKIGNPIMAKITYDVLDYHTSPVEAAEIARDAKVGHLLYYHIVPPMVIPGQDALFLDGAEDIFPAYTIGQDGVSFSLPANSSEIIKTRIGL
ncbi:ribonuclease Z [Halioglobus japonicus]|uniref:MBL fold metallo-hydrolase n=1 Tax=Halioglobus japonicus TaxID=930805 RepID=A0AAP8MH03_9GAMM|nr:MBL fold metallo-hydrolase [Halioglobus japonicus]AQA19289.1 ribonuclease Z [Halioglobus japonicus]PLW87673.1 MBL fold metallo-hydrolase [Halioglobus japonicus]GHD07186.1 ribonuclease Z [Halioglobus japonicus]